MFFFVLCEITAAQDRGAAAQDSPIKPPTPEKQSPQTTKPSAASPQVPTATPAKRTQKKIYTNDNLPSATPQDFSGDFSEINNCDRNCFEQVRRLARISPADNPRWKRELLRALGAVRKDADWQRYLRELYDTHLRFCRLGQEKREELEQVADPNNVTPGELTVDEKYEAKFKVEQNALEAIYAKQSGLQQRFALSPFSFQFAQVQVSRIQNAPCDGPPYSPPEPSGTDDP